MAGGLQPRWRHETPADRQRPSLQGGNTRTDALRARGAGSSGPPRPSASEVDVTGPAITAGAALHFGRIRPTNLTRAERLHLFAIENTTSPRPLGQIPHRMQAEPFS